MSRLTTTLIAFYFNECLFIFAALAILALAIAVNISLASLEAQAYNRITGQNVSTWDAMFVQLRVDAQPKKAD